jgi:twitching motility protein PilT
MEFVDWLTKIIQLGASDIHLHAGLRPMMRHNGKLVPVMKTPLTPEFTETLPGIMCDERSRAIFEEKMQSDLAYSIPGVARLRVNIFRQRGSVSAVLRVISSSDSQLEIVNLPEDTLSYFRNQEKGLILVTGPTGSGKSTTLARIVHEINRTHQKMIVTIEDPIEYLHQSRESVVIQREIGADAPSFAEALTAALRQDPEVIMIGEIRDRATAEAALSAAQTGHLVLSTLHTIDTVRTINRMIELFPPSERDTVRILFAESLVGIVSQRLLPSAEGQERIAAMEILKGTLRIRELVKDENRTYEIYEALKDSRFDGMQTFDDALAGLYAEDLITYETGLIAATSYQHFKMAATQIDVERGREVQSPA